MPIISVQRTWSAMWATQLLTPIAVAIREIVNRLTFLQVSQPMRYCISAIPKNGPLANCVGLFRRGSSRKRGGGARGMSVAKLRAIAV